MFKEIEAMTSLVIPIFNESRNLSKFLPMIDELDIPGKKELIFVNDGSTDNSWQMVKDFPFKTKECQFINQSTNKGKGASVILGIAAARGDIIGVQDADFEYDPYEIPKLILPIIDGKADVVYGSRFMKGEPQVHRTFHYLVNRGLTFLSNCLSGLYLSDMETCYKFFRSDILKNIVLSSQRFGFEPEVTAKISHLKIRVFELPVSYHARNYLEGKKITWKDGVAALWHIFYFNLFISKGKFFRSELDHNLIADSIVS